MLYKFVITQYNNPTRGDWTKLVKQDLNDFDFGSKLNNIKYTKLKMQ